MAGTRQEEFEGRDKAWFFIIDVQGTVMYSEGCPPSSGYSDVEMTGGCIYDSVLIDPEKKRVFKRDDDVIQDSVVFITRSGKQMKASFKAEKIVHQTTLASIGLQVSVTLQ